MADFESIQINKFEFIKKLSFTFLLQLILQNTYKNNRFLPIGNNHNILYVYDYKCNNTIIIQKDKK
jgi:hypothetical protein